MKLFIKLVLFALILNTSSLFAQLQIQFRYLSDDAGFVDATELPIMKAEIKTVYNGSEFVIPKNSIYIFEGVQIVQPFEITPLNNGWSMIKWNTEKTDFTGGYAVGVLAGYKGEFAQSGLFGGLSRRPFLNTTNQDGQVITEINCGNVVPGETYPYVVKLIGQVTLPLGEGNIKINSITTKDTNIFKIEWQGCYGCDDMAPPPKTLAPGFPYGFKVLCKPAENKYYRDEITILYEDGLIKKIPIYCNNYKITGKPLLQLVQPNGGEILTPCQDYKIKWKGNSPNLATEISYSIDNGKSWIVIAEVIDSIFVWKVPEVLSEQVKLRVRQKFDKSSEYRLAEDSSPLFSVGYNSNGGSLVTVNEDGKILEWNLFTTDKPNIINRYFINGPPDGINKYKSFGIDYFNGDKNFVLGYTYKNSYLSDTLAFYSVGNTNPYLKIPVQSYSNTRRMTIDSKRKYLAMVPYLSHEVAILDLQSTPIEDSWRKILFDAPVNDFKFNSDLQKAVVALLNGDILILNIPDFTISKKFSFPELPNIIEIAQSPNGNLISFGSQKYSNQDGVNFGQNTQILVLDINEGSIVRNFRPSPGNPVGLFFNPASTTLVIGSETEFKVSLFDLTDSRSPVFLSGHINPMTDMKLSPSGTSVTTTSTSSDNIIYRTFTYPETDVSDTILSIKQSDINNSKLTFKQEFFGTDNVLNINTIYNLGDAFIDFHDAKFQYGTNFKLEKPWQRDTLMKGDFLNFNVIYHPLDTGKINDTLVLYVCNRSYKIPFETYSIPRKLTFLNPDFDFGNVCVGDTLIKQFDLFRNDDPIDIKINFIAFKTLDIQGFRDISNQKDITLKPGEVYKGKIEFVPKKLGIHNSDLLVYYLDQLKIYHTSKVKGNGIGSFVEISHPKLLFIPEIPVRDLKIKNTGEQTLTILSLNTMPQGVFEILTSTPIIINPGQEAAISIRWNGSSNDNASLIFDTDPCLVQKFTQLALYSGTSNLKIEDVTADPRNSTSLKISFTNNGNGDYNGIRSLEGEIVMNPRYFLPQSVTSEYGTGVLTRNQIIDTLRYIGFKIEGNFPNSGIAGEISGLAGLGEDIQTRMDFIQTSLFWSKNIKTNSTSGIFRLINVVEDRRIIFPKTSIIIKGFSPNPANSFINIDFNSTDAKKAQLEIIDYLGNKVLEYSISNIIQGDNKLGLNVNSLTSGSYRLNIYSDGAVVSKSFVISK